MMSYVHVHTTPASRTILGRHHPRACRLEGALSSDRGPGVLVWSVGPPSRYPMNVLDPVKGNRKKENNRFIILLMFFTNSLIFIVRDPSLLATLINISHAHLEFF